MSWRIRPVGGIVGVSASISIEQCSGPINEQAPGQSAISDDGSLMTPHRERNTFNRRFRPLRRLGETNNKVVIIVVLCLAGGVLLLACLPVVMILVALLLPAVQQAGEAARRTQSRNNLHNMALAMHNFYDVHDNWVSGGTTGPDGQLAHSWQTHLLPYLDQSSLHQSIDLEVAWDDPGQGGVFQTIVPTYHHPGQTKLVTSRGFSATHYAGNVNVLLADSEFSIREVTDGTSNTIAAGEVAAGFKAWGDPTNLRDLANGMGAGADQFGSSSAGGAQMMFLDGSVRFVSENTDLQVLQALSTPDGGETVGAF